MKEWVVVHFTEEETVEAVPAHWFNVDLSQCVWPPKSCGKTIKEVIKRMDTPTSDWNIYSAKVLGRYDSYDVAKKKAFKAQHCSDLSSAAESVPHRKRKRLSLKPRKYSPSKIINENTSSDSDGEQSTDFNDLRMPTPPKKKIMRETDADSPQLGNTNVAPTTIAGPSRSQTASDQNEEKEFRRRVLIEINVISAKLSSHGEMLGTLIKDKHSSIINTIPSQPNVDKIISLVPLVTLDVFMEVEKLLEDPLTFEALARELSRLGGADVKALVKKIMYRILSDEIGQLFSWDGAKGKKPFKTFQLAQTVLRAARINPRTQEADEDLAILAIKSWLVRAKDRLNNRQRRTSQLSVEPNLSTEEQT